MNLSDLKTITSRGEDSRHQFKEDIRNGDSFAAKGLLPYRGLGTGIRRALQDWPQIQFINDRDGCLFTSRVERVKMPNASLNPKAPLNASLNASLSPKGPLNASLNASLTALQELILEILKEDPKASYELLESKLGKDKTTIMRNIQKMKDKGILRRLGSKKFGYWEIL